MLFAITFTLLSGKACTSDCYIQQEHRLMPIPKKKQVTFAGFDASASTSSRRSARSASRGQTVRRSDFRPSPPPCPKVRRAAPTPASGCRATSDRCVNWVWAFFVYRQMTRSIVLAFGRSRTTLKRTRCSTAASRVPAVRRPVRTTTIRHRWSRAAPRRCDPGEKD